MEVECLKSKLQKHERMEKRRIKKKKKKNGFAAERNKVLAT